MRLLDLFCGAGGAAMGYKRAGFHVVGVDRNSECADHYLGDEFIHGDALQTEFDGFDAVHASPPCQHFTRYRNAVKDIADRYEDLLAPTRARLVASGLPFVIENVPGAPLVAPVELCGSMFGLDVRRHRWFELGGADWPLMLVPGHNHLLPRRFKSSTGRANLRRTIEVGAWDESVELQRKAMGLGGSGMPLRMLSEAIPPAYTQFIGETLGEVVGEHSAATARNGVRDG